MQGRFELKYVVDGETKQRFFDAIRTEMQPDPYGENAKYRVSSVYFDTPDYQAVYEKLDGESNRKKYRLRYYGLEQNSATPGVSAAYMEIKHRIQNTVYKQRAELSQEGALKILLNARELCQLGSYTVSPENCLPICNDVQRTAAYQNLHAAQTITYIREALQGKHDTRLRVTADSRCQAYAPSCFAMVETNKGTPILDENLLVLEIKFDSAIPCWIRDILQSQHLRLQRFSKYAAGVLSDQDIALQRQLLNQREQPAIAQTTAPALPIPANQMPTTNAVPMPGSPTV